MEQNFKQEAERILFENASKRATAVYIGLYLLVTIVLMAINQPTVQSIVNGYIPIGAIGLLLYLLAFEHFYHKINDQIDRTKEINLLAEYLEKQEETKEKFKISLESPKIFFQLHLPKIRVSK